MNDDWKGEHLIRAPVSTLEMVEHPARRFSGTQRLTQIRALARRGYDVRQIAAFLHVSRERVRELIQHGPKGHPR